MRILVTGTGGFIAKHLYKKIAEGLKSGDKLVGIDRKAEFTYSNHPGQTKAWKEYEYNQAEHIFCECHLESEAWVSRLLSEFLPDVIYHFAGCSTVSSPAKKIWISNVDTTFNLLNNLPKNKKIKFVLASSVLADDPQSVYGASKAAAENLVVAYGNLGLIDPVIFRMVAVCGIGNSHGAVRDIIRKFMQDNLVTVFGKDPGSYKPYTHVEDVVNIIQYIVNNKNPHYSEGEYPITIAPHYNSIYINQICEIVDRLCPTNKPWIFNGETWAGDQEKLMIDSWMLQRILQDKPELLPPSSDVAVEKAVRDILRLEYSIVND